MHKDLTCFPQRPIKSTILRALGAEHSDISEDITRFRKTTPKTRVSYSEKALGVMFLLDSLYLGNSDGDLTQRSIASSPGPHYTIHPLLGIYVSWTDFQVYTLIF